MVFSMFLSLMMVLLSCDHCDQVFVVPEEEAICPLEMSITEIRESCGAADVGPLVCEPSWLCQIPEDEGGVGCTFCVSQTRMESWVDSNCKGLCRVEKQPESNGTIAGGVVVLKCR